MQRLLDKSAKEFFMRHLSQKLSFSLGGGVISGVLASYGKKVCLVKLLKLGVCGSRMEGRA